MIRWVIYSDSLNLEQEGAADMAQPDTSGVEGQGQKMVAPVILIAQDNINGCNSLTIQTIELMIKCFT